MGFIGNSLHKIFIPIRNYISQVKFFTNKSERMPIDSLSLVLSGITVFVGILAVIAVFKLDRFFREGIEREVGMLFAVFVSLMVVSHIVDIAVDFFDLPQIIGSFKYVFSIVSFLIIILAAYEIFEIEILFGKRQKKK